MVRYEVWAKPPRFNHRVLIRRYKDQSWQVACWTARVLAMLGYHDPVVREITQ